MRRIRFGFSLVELLVCIAIVGILVAMYLPVMGRAMRKAQEVAIKEGYRQENMENLAYNANTPNAKPGSAPTRAECRAAFRRTSSDKNGPLYTTEMLYVVKNEAEFRAYWFTLIDSAAAGTLQFDGTGALVAKDDKGKQYALPRLDVWRQNVRGGLAPIAWEFLSTNLGETSSGTIGTTVLYSDGHVEYVKYPGAYPACTSVAELSHRFMGGTP